MAITANSGFDADVDISTPGGALLFLPIGIANLLLGPFPWQFGSLRALLRGARDDLLVVPLPVGDSGECRGRSASASPRRRRCCCSPSLMTLAYALMHGNVGSAFRQRAQIFIILFIFAGVGHIEASLRARRASIPICCSTTTLTVATPPPATTTAARSAA